MDLRLPESHKVGLAVADHRLERVKEAVEEAETEAEVVL